MTGKPRPKPKTCKKATNVIAPDYDFENDGVTQSLLATFMECRKKCALTLNRWTSTKTSMPLFFGGVFHAACEHHYGLMVHGKKQDVDASIRFAMRRAEELKGDRTVVFEKADQDHELACAAVEVMFPFYANHYAKSDRKKSWIGSESEFNEPFQDSGVKTCVRGKLDGKFRANKKLWIKDTKTKGQIDDFNMIDLLTLDLQIGTYITMTEIEMREPVAGFEYDIVRRPLIKFNVGDKDQITAYQSRLRADISKRPEHYFKRLQITLEKADRQRFERDFTCVMIEFAAWMRGDIPTYHNTSACVTRYGACKYLAVCARQDFTGLYQRDELFAELDG